MSRRRPDDRIPALLRAAADAFIEHGFQRTQMDDVASRLGVSKGTIYRTVDSKDALLSAVVLWSDDGPPDPGASVLTPPPIRALATAVTNDLTATIAATELTAVVAKRHQLRSDAALGDEVERLALELYGVMHARRTAIMVLDRCAAEIPELAAVWFGDGRYALVDLWRDYLVMRSRAGSHRAGDDVLARTIVEIITTWAVKMPWDRAPRPYPDDTAAACATMIRHLTTGGTVA